MSYYNPNKKYHTNYQLDKYNKRLCLVYELLAKLHVKYGPIVSKYTIDQIEELWNYKDLKCPTKHELQINNKIPMVKWVIRNKLIINNNIWTSDFLQGVAKNGILKCSKNRGFNILRWCSNDVLTSLLKSCPYGGILSVRKNPLYNSWRNVSAFDLSFSSTSIEYLAGVLSGGRLSNRNGQVYALYTYSAEYIKSTGIPIEHCFYTGKRIKHVLISPFWPALFSHKMPEEIGSRWLNIKNAAQAQNYAVILWMIYVGWNLKKCSFSYLPSRRKIYYSFNEGDKEDGIKEKIERMWVDKRLTELDNRFKEAVTHWSKTEKITKEKNEISNC